MNALAHAPAVERRPTLGPTLFAWAASMLLHVSGEIEGAALEVFEAGELADVRHALAVLRVHAASDAEAARYAGELAGLMFGLLRDFDPTLSVILGASGRPMVELRIRGGEVHHA